MLCHLCGDSLPAHAPDGGPTAVPTPDGLACRECADAWAADARP
jgi:hypothetical protein